MAKSQEISLNLCEASSFLEVLDRMTGNFCYKQTRNSLNLRLGFTFTNFIQNKIGSNVYVIFKNLFEFQIRSNLLKSKAFSNLWNIFLIKTREQ